MDREDVAEVGRGVRIPVEGEPDLLWGYFVVCAARSSSRIPDWILRAIPPVVRGRLNLSAPELTAADIDEALGLLPDDPRPVLSRLMKPLELPVPEAGAPYALPDGVPWTTETRRPVSQDDLVYDAALLVQDRYGPGGFYGCLDALECEAWDARIAVASMMYLLILRYG